jgi:hypothetical protein
MSRAIGLRPMTASKEGRRDLGIRRRVAVAVALRGSGYAPWLLPVLHILPANLHISRVEPRGLEPLTSAMRGRSKGFAAVHCRSKNRLNKPNPRIVSPRMFAIVRAGCRQIVVSCISKYWAPEETLFIDRQDYSTPVHVVLEGSVQEARERVSGRQQTGSMQDPANGLRRIPLPRRWVNRRRVAALRAQEVLAVLHHGGGGLLLGEVRAERGIVSRRQPGMVSCSRRPRSRAIHRSSSPHTISTGRSMPPLEGLHFVCVARGSLCAIWR